MTKRAIVYEPPASEVIEHFAHQVYWEMDRRDPDSEREFAGFLKFISRAVAKNQTRKASGEFDTGIE